MSNLSKTLLLPIIKIAKSTEYNFEHFGFVDSFTECDKLYYDFKPLFLLFAPTMSLQFIEFSKALEKNQNYVETIDLLDGKVLFVFKIPSRFNHDVECIKAGRYLSLSPEFKSCFQTNVHYAKSTPLGVSVEVKHTVFDEIFKTGKSVFGRFKQDNEELTW